MVDILLANDDLSVLGGPSTVNLQVDFGPAGERGSQIFVGNGNPNTATIGQTPKIFDLYINLLASDPNGEYLYFYQYQSVDGENTWVSLFNLTPQVTNQSYTEVFESGILELSVPVGNIIPTSLVGEVSSTNFNVQANIISSNPVSQGIIIGEPETINDIVVLPLTINAIEYKDLDDSGPLSEYGWVPIDEEKIVQLRITVV